MNSHDRVKESKALYEALEKCTEADFDGHSLFSTFTPSQRLEWLEQARADLIELKGISQFKQT